MPGEGVEPSCPLRGHLILSRSLPLGPSRQIRKLPAIRTYATTAAKSWSRLVSVGLVVPVLSIAGETSKPPDGLEPSTPFL